ncbi:MAG: PrgI family protein [Minisyncoccia bacterium]|jgi:hypothetical protein
MRFQVPQFIETETKLVGPLTLRQFIYIGAGALIIFLLRYVLTSVFLWIMADIPIGALAAGLAFYKIDSVPLPRYLVSATSFLFGGKKYIYKKEPPDNSDVNQLLNKN